MRLRINYLQIALAHAHECGHDVKALPLEEALERFSAIPHAERKKNFEVAIEKVLQVLPEINRKSYKCALGKYFSQFPREKPTSRWMPQVLEASAFRVVMQIYPELKATFFPVPSSAKKSQLGWKDIAISKELLSGSAVIGEETFKKAKRQALAILNQRRAYKGIAA